MASAYEPQAVYEGVYFVPTKVAVPFELQDEVGGLMSLEGEVATGVTRDGSKLIFVTCPTGMVHTDEDGDQQTFVYFTPKGLDLLIDALDLARQDCLELLED